MTWEEMVFLGVVFLNTLVARGDLLLGCLVMVPGWSRTWRTWSLIKSG